MATYETPVQHEDHYIERDSGSSGALWAVIVVVLAVVLFLLFNSRIFNRGGSNGTNGSGTNVNGTVNTPNGTYQGSGSVNTNPQ